VPRRTSPGPANGNAPPPRRAPGHPGTPAEKRRLRAQGERTVRKLLDAGIEVFGRSGYHAARVDDIVKLAKTSHGTFYLYFSNKEDLFRRLALDIGDELTALVDQMGDLEPTPAARQQLRTWLGTFLDVYRHYGPLLRAWTTAEIETTETGRLGTDVLGRFAAAISERVARIPGLTTDPQVTGLALVAMIERFSFFVLARQVLATEDEVLDTLTEGVWRTLFGRSESHTPSNHPATTPYGLGVRRDRDTPSNHPATTPHGLGVRRDRDT
jgi:AcrR family transcriptional regulator